MGSQGVLDHLLAPLERRQRPRIDGLILSEGERGTLQATLPGQPASPSAPAQVTLWEENPDLTAIVQTLGALAGLIIVGVDSAEALLAEAAQACPGDVVTIDCSLALEEDMARCARVVTQTAVPLYIMPCTGNHHGAGGAVRTR